MDCSLLFEILLVENPGLALKENEDYLFSLIPDLAKCKGFEQNNCWHIYDVYEHILKVVDGVSSNLTVRLAALFHDIGKPYVYTKDELGVGHFCGHWNKSKEIFMSFAKEYNLNEDLVKTVFKLIIYHDLNFENISDAMENVILNGFTKEELMMLFELKESDLLAQNEQFHHLLDNYKKQKSRLLCRIHG